MTSPLIPIILPLVWIAMGIPGYFMIRSGTPSNRQFPALWTAFVCVIYGPVPTIVESIWFCIKRLQ